MVALLFLEPKSAVSVAAWDQEGQAVKCFLEERRGWQVSAS